MDVYQAVSNTLKVLWLKAADNGSSSWSFGFIVFVIALALAFDFTNGLHDAANSVATVVSTRVLNPKQAVVWAAFFNFVLF